MYIKKPIIGNILKEILPSNSRYMTMHISELPTEVLSEIVSYKLGEPKYMRLKHSRGLRKIQKKYKPYYTEEEREEYEYFELMPDYSEVDMKGLSIKYKVMQGEYRRDLLCCIDKQYKKIKNIIDKEIEEQLKQDYDISSIHIAIRRKYQDDREYDVRHLNDSDRSEQWNIRNVQNFDNELGRIINDKQYIEADLNIDYNDEGAVISSYNISINLRFKNR